MQDNISSATETRRKTDRVIIIGVMAIVAILVVAALLLFLNLPDANAFNMRVEEIFITNDALTNSGDIKLLEILASLPGSLRTKEKRYLCEISSRNATRPIRRPVYSFRGRETG